MQAVPKAKYFYTVFTSPEGKQILNFLKDQTSDLSCLSHNTLLSGNISLNPAEFVFLREGQNSIIRYIEMMIKNFENEGKK